MASGEATVFVVDDDPAVRDSLQWLIESVDLGVSTYESGVAFLDGYDRDRAGCLLLDIRMPGMSGLDVQEELRNRSIEIPIIFLTGHGDVHLAVRAMKAGAFDFIEKPFNDQQLLDLVHKAIRKDAETAIRRAEERKVRDRFDSLTERERQVLDGVVRGQPNKTIAAELNLHEKTVEFHRAKLMEKMEARSLAELVRMSLIVEHDQR